MSDFYIVGNILKRYTGKGGHVTIPTGVTEIGDGAFIGSRNVTGITIPDTVQKIGNEAFFQRKILKNIVIPDSVTSIGTRAFKDCFELDRVTLGKGVTEIGDFAFSYCGNLKQFTIGSNLTKIGAYAFEKCSVLKKLRLPDTVKTIESGAFSCCYLLGSLNIPAEIESIGSMAIPKYIRLELPASFRDEARQIPMILERFGISRFPIPFVLSLTDTYPDILKKATAKAYRVKNLCQLIEEEDAEHFRQLLNLIPSMSSDEIDLYLERSVEKHTVEITNMLITYKNSLYSKEQILEMQTTEMEKELGIREKTVSDYRKDFKIAKNNAVYEIRGYKSMKDTVNVPSSIKGIPVTIGEKAFYDCQHIRAVYIDDGVKEIGSQAFEKCYKLETIEIPESVETIRPCAFYECFCLQSITIPGNVGVIGSWTFYKCSSLKSVTLMEGIKEIGVSSFYGCQSLEEIIIPESVTDIHSLAFYECKKLTIRAPKGSYAEKYANMKGFPFQEI